MGREGKGRENTPKVYDRGLYGTRGSEPEP